MKNLIMTIASIVALVCAQLAYAADATTKTTKTESLDKIVAVVNDDVVTSSELNEAMHIAKLQIAQSKVKAPSQKELRKEVLNQLINNKLQLQLAERANIQVSNTEVSNAIKDIASKNHMSVNDMYTRLKKDGMTKDEYRREIKRQITMQRLSQQEIANDVTVSKDEIDSYLHSDLWRGQSVKQYQLDDILVPLPDEPTAAQKAALEKVANGIYNELKAGKAVSAAIKTASKKDHDVTNNDLGWRSLSEIPSAFAQKVVGMEKDDISAPIETGNGYHILRLSKVRTKQEGGTPTRKQVEQMLLQQKFEEAAQNWMSKMRSQAFVAMK